MSENQRKRRAPTKRLRHDQRQQPRIEASRQRLADEALSIVGSSLFPEADLPLELRRRRLRRAGMGRWTSRAFAPGSS